MRGIFIVVLSFFLLSILPVSSRANISPQVTFSQEIIGFDANGSPFPLAEINPATIQGMRTLTFALDQSHKLAIKTNIADAESRGLDRLVDTIQKCYAFVQEETKKPLAENILLYLIELDTVPDYYSFKMSFNRGEMDWGEVRLILTDKGTPLFGPNASASLHELMYDTLPHELGHDVLGDITNLLHDIDGQPSYHTRWFIEGVCEVLAKKFSRMEAPYLWGGFLARRHVDKVLTDSVIRERIFGWAQENSNRPDLESDLYGASMLLLMDWTRVVNLQQLLDRIDNHNTLLSGPDIMTMMEASTNHTRNEILDHAHQLGKRLLSTATDQSARNIE